MSQNQGHNLQTTPQISSFDFNQPNMVIGGAQNAQFNFSDTKEKNLFLSNSSASIQKVKGS